MLGYGIEKKETTTQEPHFFRVDYEFGDSIEDIRSEIAAKLNTDGKGLLVRVNSSTSRRVPLEAKITYVGRLLDPVIFTFQVFGDKRTTTSYENIGFNPYNEHAWRFEPVDIVDCFAIAHKALMDGVSPLQINSAFHEIFDRVDLMRVNVQDMKTKLAKELTARKYLP